MKRIIPWLGAAAILVIIFGTIYAVTQQSQRRAANNPQIQLAEDAAASLNRGTPPTNLASGTVDMSKSLTPFIIIYDKSGRIVGGAGSGYLENRIPAVPYGVLSAANGKDYHFVTWQPAPNVRIAAVTVAANNYYVLSGRNMKEVEVEESRTMVLAAFGCLASLAVLGAAWEFSERVPRK